MSQKFLFGLQCSKNSILMKYGVSTRTMYFIIITNQHCFLCLQGGDFYYLAPWYYPPLSQSQHRFPSKVECYWWGSPGRGLCRTRPCWWGSTRRASVSPQPLSFSDHKTQDHHRNWQGCTHQHKMQRSLEILPHLCHWTWKLQRNPMKNMVKKQM